MQTPSPCALKADVVMVALISNTPGRSPLDPVTVKVEEMLKGPKNLHEAVLHTAAGDCSLVLQPGKRYVIFAEKTGVTGAELSTTQCSSSFLLTGRENILEAMRSGASNGRFRLAGVVRTISGMTWEQPLPQARVVVEGDRGRAEVLTDELGRFEFTHLKQGNYHLSVAKDRYSSDEHLKSASTAEVSATKRGCEVHDLNLWPDGKLSGKVTGQDGRPVKGVEVEVFQVPPADWHIAPFFLRATTTNEDGSYELRPVPDGEFIVGIGLLRIADQPYVPVVFPSGQRLEEAAPIHLAKFGQRSGLDLMVQRK
jgi:hypothetical protein